MFRTILLNEPVLRRGIKTRVTDRTKVAEIPVPLRLNNICDNPGARKPKVRLGRGRGSGCGKTSGRGQKGQRARNSVRHGFEGGQTPLHKRLPKLPKPDPFAKPLEPLPLGRVQRFVDIGRLDGSKEITIRDLVRSGCLRQPKHGVILMRGGLFGSPLKVQVSDVEPDAARDVVRHGGVISLAWYNRLGLRALIKREKWLDRGLPLPRWARPPPKVEHRYPERREDGLPVRTIRSEEDIDKLQEAWKRVVHLREDRRII